MIRLLSKNNFTLWLKWVRNTYFLKKKFPTAVIGFMAKAKGECYLGPNSRLDNFALIENTTIGDFSYVGTEARLNHSKVGKFCSIGPAVYGGLGVHPTSVFVSTSNHFYSGDPLEPNVPYFKEYRETIIGHDVWIGARATLIDGIKIGDGAVIGAGAVVTKDVPPYAIAVGVPAKVVKYRFNPEEIAFLLAFEWWNKDPEWIMQNRNQFQDIKKFMEKHLSEEEASAGC